MAPDAARSRVRTRHHRAQRLDAHAPSDDCADAARRWHRRTTDARARTHASALARMPAADRGKPRANVSRRGLRAIEAARKALAAQAAAGKDPRASAPAGRKRGDANAEQHLRNHRWAREHPGQRDRAWFEREVVPKLDAFSLREIAAATGLSLAACSRIRAGSSVPHSRHWGDLVSLVRRLKKNHY